MWVVVISTAIATGEFSETATNYYDNRPTYADYERERRWRESLSELRRITDEFRDFVRASAVPRGRLHADPGLRIESPIVASSITQNEHRLRWLARARGGRRERKPRRWRLRVWERDE